MKYKDQWKRGVIDPVALLGYRGFESPTGLLTVVINESVKSHAYNSERKETVRENYFLV